MKEALFYRREAGAVRCLLCPNLCLIQDGERGRCGVRLNKGGVLYTEIYEQATSLALDPIEKKPLYHYHRGRMILSVGTRGCNFLCPWCQNWSISQDRRAATRQVTPKDLIEKARSSASFGIAYTYNEPFIWYEFILDCARAVSREGLENILVTNGYVNEEPFEKILPFINAMNIDVKGMTEDFYKRYCGGALEPVLKNAERAVRSGVHVEITNLVITGLNDADRDFKMLTDWIAERLGCETPLHFSRYFPCYKFSEPPTDLDSLKRARDIASKKLKNVYLGNV